MELSQEVKVVKGLPDQWGTCSRTVTFNESTEALACWKNTIAVGLKSGDIITLDGITGTQTAILSGHADPVRSLAYLPDGSSLVSGSTDMTIKLWDVQTGGVVKTLHGHTHYVTSVSISSDCTMIASGSVDKTIHLWNIQTEECHCIIEQQEAVEHVVFSPTNPQHLVSVSGNQVWHWDINGQQSNPVQYGFHIAFSLDGSRFVLYQGGDFLVRSTSSGFIVARLHVGHDLIQCCCISPNGRLVAAAADSITYIWDTLSSDPHPINTFAGHTDNITSLAFYSSSLISSSFDSSVKFWQIGALQTDPAVTDPMSTLPTSTPIRFLTLEERYGIVISRDSKGVVRSWNILTGCNKESFQTPADISEQICLWLANSTLILVGYNNHKVNIWSSGRWGGFTGPNLIQVDIEDIEDIRISGNGFIIFCLCPRYIRALSWQTGEVVGEVKLEVCQLQRHLTVDGSRVWVHSPELEPLGWDFMMSPSPPTQLLNNFLLNPNHTKCWDIRQSRIVNAVTQRVVFQLAGRFAKPTTSHWNGQYLVAGYESGEVLILAINHM